MQKPTILITGAGGYIGSNAVYLFLQKGFEVVGIDNFSKGYKQPLELLQKMFGKEKFRYYKYDLLEDLSPLFCKEPYIAAVIHYAALCDVDESVKEPQKYFTNNVCGSQNLFSSMIKHGAQQIIFSSTCAVYGEAQYIRVDEKHPVRPLSPYGQSKFMVEELLDWYGRTGKLRYVVLRYFNVTGASEDGMVGDSKKPSSLLIPNVVRAALGIAPFYFTCTNVDTEDKTPIRDFVNVVDLNTAHLQALEYLLQGGKSDFFNIGTGVGNSVLDIVKAVEKITKKTVLIGKAVPRQGEVPRIIASNKKIKRVLGWSPRHSLGDSIKSFLLWYKKYPDGWSY